MDAVVIVACTCGQQWRGTVAEILPAVQRHGRDVHNMDVSAEQVLAMARPGDTETP